MAFDKASYRGLVSTGEVPVAHNHIEERGVQPWAIKFP